MALGLNLGNLGKILKCAGNDDVVTLKSQEEGDKLSIMFENPSQVFLAAAKKKTYHIFGEGEEEAGGG